TIATPAICERICPALAIVDDESSDGHRLHRMRGDADSDMADAGRNASQDHSVLRGKLSRLLCHGLLLAAARPEHRHRSRTHRRVTMRRQPNHRESPWPCLPPTLLARADEVIE